MESAIGSRADSTNQSGSKTSLEQAGIDDVKRYLRRLRNALPRAIRKANDAGMTMAMFQADEPLRRSTPKLVGYLLKIRPAVIALDEALKKHFNGKKASEELDAVKAALEGADTEQETARALGPLETQALNETVGTLIEAMEDSIRAGKSAFDGDAQRAALFNKDILLRARRKNEAAEPTTNEK